MWKNSSKIDCTCGVDSIGCPYKQPLIQTAREIIVNQNTIKWTRINGVYFSKDGKYKISNAGNSNWYLYINDGTNFWDVNYTDWSSNLQGAKFWAEYHESKVSA